MTKIEMKRRAFAKLTEVAKWTEYAALNKKWSQQEEDQQRLNTYWNAFTLVGLLDDEEAQEAVWLGEKYAAEICRKEHELQDAG